jgi:hypothetical protein
MNCKVYNCIWHLEKAMISHKAHGLNNIPDRPESMFPSTLNKELFELPIAIHKSIDKIRDSIM